MDFEYSTFHYFLGKNKEKQRKTFFCLRVMGWIILGEEIILLLLEISFYENHHLLIFFKTHVLHT